VPDVTAYADLWLGIGLLAQKDTTKSMRPAVKLVTGDLIKIFNGNRRWKAIEFEASDCAIIASVLSACQVGNEKFVADLGDIIKHTLKGATELDLVLLTKGAFYMRDFRHTKDLYAQVHAECTSRSNLR